MTGISRSSAKYILYHVRNNVFCPRRHAHIGSPTPQFLLRINSQGLGIWGFLKSHLSELIKISIHQWLSVTWDASIIFAIHSKGLLSFSGCRLLVVEERKALGSKGTLGSRHKEDKKKRKNRNKLFECLFLIMDTHFKIFFFDLKTQRYS